MKLILQLNLQHAWWYFCFWVFIKINIHKNMEKCLTINIYYSNEYFIILLYIYKRSGRYTITNRGRMIVSFNKTRTRMLQIFVK